MRTVTVEEHFASPGFLDGPGRELRAQASKFGAAAAKLLEGLCDVGGQKEPGTVCRTCLAPYLSAAESR